MTRRDGARPQLGMMVILHDGAGSPLAGKTAEIVDVWPRFASGETLISLRLVDPVRLGRAVIAEIDAFLSEVDIVGQAHRQPERRDLPTQRRS